MCLTLPAKATGSFLSEICAYDVRDNVCIDNEGVSIIDRLAIECLLTETPIVYSEEGHAQQDIRAAIAFPIFRNDMVVSVVVLATTTPTETAGVFEVWTPKVDFEEVALADGYFGDSVRFQNASSYVRSGKGAGLPGQVWSSLRSVIHSKLPNHKGFPRTARANAGCLESAIGIPVAGDDFVACVVLISGEEIPMARGFEVWNADADGGYSLNDCWYRDGQLKLELGTRMSSIHGVAALACEHGGATVTHNPAILNFGRPQVSTELKLKGCLAIPFYENDLLTSVTALLL